MSPLFVIDDGAAERFEPFALTRPAGSLVVGAWPIWRRWRAALQCEVAGFIGAAHLDGFDDPPASGVANSPRMASGVIPAKAVVASARFAPRAAIHAGRRTDQAAHAAREPAPDPSIRLWRGGTSDRTAAVRLAREMRVEELREAADDLAAVADPDGADDEVSGWWVDEVWDYIRLLSDVLADDLGQVAQGPFGGGAKGFAEPPDDATVLGEHPVLVGVVDASYERANHAPPMVERHVVLDATAGPIVIAQGAQLHAFTRLTGPCYIGPGSVVLGGDLSVCSIGPVCKVRGEMSHTVMLGYSNKAHDGFIGHSILGRWTNLGAGTITSNLKNTYGAVSLWTPEGIRDTGMQFLGTLAGDHVKTGIGMRLTTGTVLGAGANVYGSAMPPKAVPPFAWGERPPYDIFGLDKFLNVAERAMSRRKVDLSDGARRQLSAAHGARWTVEERK